MKKLLLLSTMLVAISAYSQQLFFDDFESYTVGDYVGESSEDWTTWSNADGTDEDAFVSDDFASSGTNSMKIETTSPTGGPMDVFLPLGYSEGVYAVSFQLYVPQGSGCYYNFQTTTTVADGWAFDMYFLANGTVSLEQEQMPIAGSTYAPSAWHLVTHIIDLDSDMATIMIDGMELGSVPHPSDLGGVNLFAFGGDGESLGLYYVDDFEVLQQEVSVNENADINYSMYPNPSTDLVTIDYAGTNVNTIRVMNISGQDVMNFSPANVTQKEIIDVSDLSQGIYFVELTSNGIRSTQKLIVK